LSAIVTSFFPMSCVSIHSAVLMSYTDFAVKPIAVANLCTAVWLRGARSKTSVTPFLRHEIELPRASFSFRKCVVSAVALSPNPKWNLSLKERRFNPSHPEALTARGLGQYSIFFIDKQTIRSGFLVVFWGEPALFHRFPGVTSSRTTV
jgi:hypothetical protein